MTPSHTVQGLASLGRNGDSMLMHVSPKEVQGLQGLAMSHGGSLTINPHTGLPEAFSLGSFLTSLLPAAAGFMVGGPAGAGLGLKAGTTAATLAPIAAGMVTGAAVAGIKGEDALMGGLMGGLGGYGGGNLGSAFGKMGAPPGGFAVGTEASKNLVGPQLTAEGGLSAAGSGQGMATTLANQAAPTTYLQGLQQMGSGATKLLSPGGYDAYKTAGGSGMQLASTFGVPAIQEFARIEPTDTNLASEAEAKRKAEENKYRDPRTGLLNLTQASPDVKFVAEGGSIQSGGLRDLYGTPDNQPTMSPGLGGFGLGRLNDLSSEQAKTQAQTYGYAMGGLTALKPGGYLDGQGDGMSDSIPATIEGKQPARLADGEFVVPADVVSHLGNGSSKAGSQRLYSMLDKIRHARTGTKKQGKQINPSKYMPA